MDRSACCAGALLLLFAAPAHAQTASAPPTPAATNNALANAHYQTGSAEYRAGHFAQAAVEFREAYQLSHEPVLLFNLGSALYDSGDLAAALDAFESYLRGVPNAPNRGIVEGRIAAIRSRLAATSSSAPASPSPSDVAVSRSSPSPAPREIPPPPAPGIPIAPIVVGGAGVLIAASSAVFYALRGSAISSCADDGTAIVCPDRATADRGILFSALTNWTLGVGGVLVLGGIVWFVVARNAGRPPRVTASAVVLPEGGAIVGVGGRF
jgi:tetratricopeptide (TPR) repeat protein